MDKSLVIVESPAKAKTINKYLGKDFIVKSSVGHIRDLPTSGSARPVDAKARAKAAAETRKLNPEQKVIHKARKAKERQPGKRLAGQLPDPARQGIRGERIKKDGQGGRQDLSGH